MLAYFNKMPEIKNYRIPEIEVIGLWGISVSECYDRSKRTDTQSAKTIPLNGEIKPVERCGNYALEAKQKIVDYLIAKLSTEGEWESKRILKNRRLEDMTLRDHTLENKTEGGNK